MRTTEFSKYEIRKMGVKFNEATATSFKSADCVGSLEEELDVIVISKKCRGVETKKRPRGAGTGTLNVSLHIPYDIYCGMFDMTRDDLIKGVQGYGSNNFHKEFMLTMEVYNEDNEKLLLAYPRCICAVGPNTNIENGAEEVAEVEMEISIMPDLYGYCRYEAMPGDLDADHSGVANNWMDDFTPTMVNAGPEA